MRIANLFQARYLRAKKMLTREEIAEIVQYCKEKGVSYKSRLKEIGIAEWRFYESKRRYAEAQASERESGEFLQLVRGNDSFPEPVLTDRKTGRGRRSGQESIPMSIEMRTQTGAVLRIRGNLDAAMIQAIIQADYITLNVPPVAFSNVPLQTWSHSVRQS